MKSDQIQPGKSEVRTRAKPFRSSCIGTARGFTLIELMLVLALIAIMAAMIVPEMKGSMEDSLLRSSARQVVDLFNLTYSRAVSLNQQHRVRLNTRNGQYQVEQQSQEFLASGLFQPILNAPIDCRERQRHIKWDIVGVGRQRFEVSSDFIANIAGGSGAVASHDAEVDHPVLH